MYTKIIGILICLSLSIGTYSQSASIKGKITNKNGEHVSYASIALQNYTYGATTNESGTYQLKNIPAGNYSLIVTAVDYEDYIKNISLTKDTILELDISMVAKQYVLQTVEVTGRKESTYRNSNSFAATKIEMAVKDIPQSISFVTKELIQDRQALRLRDVVQNVAGVNEFSVYDDITMRGFRNMNDNGRLINGLRIYNNFWTSPLLVNIERVEFIKGPASSTFANTNPGGTINMVTKKPLPFYKNALNIAVGSYNTYRLQGDFSGPFNDKKSILYRLNVGYENAGSYRDQLFHKSMVIAPSVTFIPREGTTMNVDFVYSNLHTLLDRGRTIVRGTKDVFATPIGLNIAQPGDFLKSQQGAITLSLSQKITGNLSFSASFLRFKYYEHLNEHRFNKYITNDSLQMIFIDRITTFEGNNLTSYLTYKHQRCNVKQTVVAGYDYIDGFNTRQSRNATGIANGVADISLKNLTHKLQPISSYIFPSKDNASFGDKYYTQGAYIQDLILYKRFQLLLSLRKEFYTYPVTDFNTKPQKNGQPGQQRPIGQSSLLPRIGITYSVTNNVNIYSTYATGFEPQSGGTLANPNVGGPFRPLTSNLIEAGAKGEFFNKRLFAGLGIYQITLNDVLVSANDSSNPDLLTQRGQELAKGVEIELTGKINSCLSINVNYAFNDARITKDKLGDPDKKVGLIKENAPRHISSSWIKYEFRDTELFKGIGVAIGHSQVSKRETFDRDLKLPSYIVWNAAISYRVNHLKLALNINNLGNTKYLSGGYNYERNFPGAPRNYMLSIGYDF